MGNVYYAGQHGGHVDNSHFIEDPAGSFLWRVTSDEVGQTVVVDAPPESDELLVFQIGRLLCWMKAHPGQHPPEWDWQEHWGTG